MNKHSIPALAAATLGLLLTATPLAAHCQVPCGIYDDPNVIAGMNTDWLTIEKASAQIIELSKDPAANANQLTRWIVNKETHAQNIQDTVSAYFLAQRLKLPEGDADKDAYLKKLTLCHKVIVAAMKCKQSTDPAAVEIPPRPAPRLQDRLRRLTHGAPEPPPPESGAATIPGTGIASPGPRSRPRTNLPANPDATAGGAANIIHRHTPQPRP